MTRQDPQYHSDRVTKPVAAWILRRALGPRAGAVISDLSEEAGHRLANGTSRARIRWWWAREVVLILAHETKDLMRHQRLNPPQAWSLHGAQALKLAFRSIQHEPTSALYGALTLAVGFGAAAANFSTLEGFTRPLPVPHGEEVVRASIISRSGDNELTRDEALTLAGLTVFETSGVYSTREPVFSVEGRAPRRVSAARFDPGVLTTLEVSPELGVIPTGGLDPATVAISRELWQNWLDGAPEVIGRVIAVDGVPHTITAVLPQQFRFPVFQQAWLPFTQVANESGSYNLVGRLASGQTRPAASNDLTGVLQSYRTTSGSDDSVRVSVIGFTEGWGEAGEEQGLLALLFIVIALVLVSCSNVSNLLFVRGAGRARALALHRALGAPPRQIVTQLLLESAIISLSGALIGFGIAWGLVTFLQRTLQPHWGFHWMDVSIQPSVLIFLGLLAIVTAIVSGTFPALKSARSNIMSPLKAETAAHRGGANSRGPQVFLTVQVALSSVALVAAVFLTAGLTKTRRVSEGIDPTTVFHTAVTLQQSRYKSVDERARFRDRLVDGLTRSSLERVTVTSAFPLLAGASQSVDISGIPNPSDGPPNRSSVYGISPGFFSIFGLRFSDGRDFLEGEGSHSAPVGIVNAGFVDEFMNGENPVGRLVRVYGDESDSTWIRIVGVTSDIVLVEGDRSRKRPTIYRPLSQVDASRLFITVADSRSAVGEAIASTLNGIDPDIPLDGNIGSEGLATLDDTLAYLLRLYEIAALLALLGGTGTALVVGIGLYGALAFEVQQRLPEFGVRMALGANRRRVLSNVITRGFRRIGPGLVIGLIVAWFVMPIFGIFLSDIHPRDPRIFAALLGTYAIITVAASSLPGQRAANSDPATVLRGD